MRVCLNLEGELVPLTKPIKLAVARFEYQVKRTKPKPIIQSVAELINQQLLEQQRKLCDLNEICKQYQEWLAVGELSNEVNALAQDQCDQMNEYKIQAYQKLSSLMDNGDDADLAALVWRLHQEKTNLQKQIQNNKKQSASLKFRTQNNRGCVNSLEQQLNQKRSSLSKSIVQSEQGKLERDKYQVRQLQICVRQDQLRLLMMSFQCSFFDQERKSRSVFTVLNFVERQLKYEQLFKCKEWCKLLNQSNKIELGRNQIRLGTIVRPQCEVVPTLDVLLKLFTYDCFNSIMKRFNFCSYSGLMLIQPGLSFDLKVEKSSLVFITVNGKGDLASALNSLVGWSNQVIKVVDIQKRRVQFCQFYQVTVIKKNRKQPYLKLVYNFELQLQLAQDLIRKKKGEVVQQVEKIKGDKKIVMLFNFPWLAFDDEYVTWQRLLQFYKY